MLFFNERFVLDIFFVINTRRPGFDTGQWNRLVLAITDPNLPARYVTADHFTETVLSVFISSKF